MPAIAVVDDRTDMRETLARNIQLDLPKPWSVLQSDPLPTISDYPSWIAEKEVAALILDEKLQERIPTRRTYVDYLGHELATYLRKHMPELPIFMVTTYRGDAALRDTKNEVAFEEIFDREKFFERSSLYTARILRTAQRFLDTYQKELAALATCASKIASGHGSRGDKEQLLALQTKISGAFPSIVATADSAAHLADLEAAVTRLEQVTRKAKQLTKKGKPKK